MAVKLKHKFQPYLMKQHHKHEEKNIDFHLEKFPSPPIKTKIVHSQ